MQIQSNPLPGGRSLNQTPPQQTPAEDAPPPAPQDGYTPPEGPGEFLGGWGPVIGAAAVGAGLGAYAGLSTGVLPALAGAAAGTGLGVVGAAGFARAGLDEASGAAGIGGFFAGAALGAYVGYAVQSPVAAAALGVTGALGFAFYKAMSGFNN